MNAFLGFRDYARALAARLAQGGWRPFWGWGGGALALKLIYFAGVEVPERHLAVPDGFYVFVLGFASLYVTTFIARAVEKQVEMRAMPNAPAARRPGIPIDGPAMGPGAMAMA